MPGFSSDDAGLRRLQALLLALACGLVDALAPVADFG